MYIRLQLELSLEIRVLHILGLCPCPGFQPHLPDQAQIEDFGVMRYFGCSVCVRMKIITRKVRALMTEVEFSFRDAPVNIAWLSPVKEIWSPSLAPTPLTYRLLRWDAHVLGDSSSQFFVLIGQVHQAVVTIQSAGCRHRCIVHRRAFFLICILESVGTQSGVILLCWLAGDPGFEPGLTDPESVVLPLD